MNIKDIQELIDLYWNGETTVDEEKSIREFFASNNNLPKDMEQWQNWFIGENAINRTILDDSFEENILSYLEQPEQPHASASVKYIKLKHILWLSASIAAILVAVCFFRIDTDKSTHITQDMSLIEAQKNYELLKELLYLTSSTINQAEAALEENINRIGIINEYINIK